MLKLEFFKLFNTTFGKYEPYDKQLQVHEALDQYRNVYFLAGRQSGKTIAAAMEAVYALLVPHTDGKPAEISLVGDKLSFTEKIFEQVEFILTNTPDLKKRIKKSNHSSSRMEITLKNGASLRCKSSHNPTTLSGDTVSFLITEESNFVSDRAMSLARPTMAIRQAKHLAIGTANVTSEWFKEAYFKYRDGHDSESIAFHASSTDNPYFSLEEFEKVKQDETARNVRLLYLAEFSSNDNRVFSDELLDECLTLPVPKKRARPTIEGRRFVAGVDIGRKVDYTVIAVLDVTDYPAELVHLERFNGKEPDATAKAVASVLGRFDALGWIDATGMGDSYYSGIKRYYHNVRPYIFTGVSKNPLIEGLVVKLEQGDIKLFPDSDLKKEFEGFVVKKLASGHVTYAAEGSKHDDIPIAVSLAALGVRTSYDFKAPRIRIL